VSEVGPPFSAEDWTRFLSSHLGREVRVRYGKARRQVIVVYPERQVLRVRMNQAFGQAPPPVRTAVADWLRAGRRAERSCRALDAWIASVHGSLGPGRPPRLNAHGAHYDLGELLEELLAAEFPLLPQERRPSGVTWGRRGRRGARHSLQLGSFDPETALIRVHPVLDQPAVPRWFVRYVVFHEVLHSELNEPCAADRRARHHGPEFRRRETAYADTARALEWQEKNLGQLLRSARTGKPMSLPAGRAPLRWMQRLLFETSS
jgi:hypothetical protein